MTEIVVSFSARSLFSKEPDRLWGPPGLLFIGTGGPYPRGIKQPRHEADHSPPSKVEVKNGWNCTVISFISISIIIIVVIFVVCNGLGSPSLASYQTGQGPIK